MLESGDINVWGNWEYGPLAPGQVYWRTNTVSLPQQSGTYYLIFSADNDGYLFEGNNGNNVLASVPVTLTYEVRPPDLAPITVLPDQTNIEIGRATCREPAEQVVWGVTNQGVGPALNSWYDR